MREADVWGVIEAATGEIANKAPITWIAVVRCILDQFARKLWWPKVEKIERHSRGKKYTKN